MQKAEVIPLCFEIWCKHLDLKFKKKLMDFQRYLKNVMLSGHNEIISEVK